MSKDNYLDLHYLQSVGHPDDTKVSMEGTTEVLRTPEVKEIEIVEAVIVQEKSDNEEEDGECRENYGQHENGTNETPSPPQQMVMCDPKMFSVH